MSDGYRNRGEIGAHLIECRRCYALLVDDYEGCARFAHDNFHDRVEAALSASQGYPVT